MNERDQIIYTFAFMQCVELYAMQAPNPEQAQLKHRYIQDKMIKEILPANPTPEMLRETKELIDELTHSQYYMKMIDLMKQKVTTDNMMDALKKSSWFDDLRFKN